jgi:hypothetical protein
VARPDDAIRILAPHGRDKLRHEKTLGHAVARQHVGTKGEEVGRARPARQNDDQAAFAAGCLRLLVLDQEVLLPGIAGDLALVDHNGLVNPLLNLLCTSRQREKEQNSDRP